MNETWLENPAFVVIGISLAACTANEFLAWLFVYRQDRFKYLKSQLLLGEKKLEVLCYLLCARARCVSDNGRSTTATVDVPPSMHA